MYKSIMKYSISLAIIFYILLGSCFAQDNIFYGQSIEAELFAKKLGIENQVFYSSKSNPLVYRSSVDAESFTTVDMAKVESLHKEITYLLLGKTAKEPDAIHLHLDHTHNYAHKLSAFYDELTAICERT